MSPVGLALSLGTAEQMSKMGSLPRKVKHMFFIRRLALIQHNPGKQS